MISLNILLIVFDQIMMIIKNFITKIPFIFRRVYINYRIEYFDKVSLVTSSIPVMLGQYLIKQGYILYYSTNFSLSFRLLISPLIKWIGSMTIVSIATRFYPIIPNNILRPRTVTIRSSIFLELYDLIFFIYIKELVKALDLYPEAVIA